MIANDGEYIALFVRVCERVLYSVDIAKQDDDDDDKVVLVWYYYLIITQKGASLGLLVSPKKKQSKMHFMCNHLQGQTRPAGTLRRWGGAIFHDDVSLNNCVWEKCVGIGVEKISKSATRRQNSS